MYSQKYQVLKRDVSLKYKMIRKSQKDRSIFSSGGGGRRKVGGGGRGGGEFDDFIQHGRGHIVSERFVRRLRANSLSVWGSMFSGFVYTSGIHRAL